jgi:PAS domain S-box-containing protein
MKVDPAEHLVDGRYAIQDLVDLDELRSLFQSFSDTTGFTIGFLNVPQLEVLIATNWRPLCTKYHRMCPRALKRCKESNARLVSHLKRPEQIVIERCENGLVDCATPIFIRGKKVAILATGQVLLKPPDIERFRRQAQQYGVDEKAYLKELRKIPVIAPKDLKKATSFLGQLAHLVTRLGYDHLLQKRLSGNLTQDILRRITLEEELKKSRRTLQAIFDNTYQFTGLMTLEGRLLEANQTALNFAGARMKEIRNQRFWKTPWWKHSEAVRKEIRQAIRKAAKGQFVRYETTVCSKDGISHEIDFSVKPVRDANGKVVQLIAEGRDISLRKSAERKIHEAGEQIKALYEATPDAVLVASLKSRKIIKVNQRACELFGYTEAQFLNKHMRSLHPRVDLPDVIRKFQALAQDRITFVTDVPCLRKNGKVFFADIGAQTAFYGGEKCLVGFFRDVTERRRIDCELQLHRQHLESLVSERTTALNRSRDYLGKIINSVGNPIFVKDRKHKWVLLNDAYCKFMGYRREQLLGKSDMDFFPRREAKVFWSKDEWVFRNRKTNINEEQFTDSKGVTHTILTKKVLYRDNEGEEYIVGIITDITTRKRMEEELKRQQEHLEDLVKARTFKLEKEIEARWNVEKELRESESRYRKFFEGSHDAMMTLEPPSWKFTSANSAMARMFGVKDASVFLSIPPWKISPPRQPDGQSSAVKAMKMIRKAMRRGSHFFEWTHRHLDGTVFPVEVLLTRVEREEGAFLQATVRDITERKRVEEQLRESEKQYRSLVETTGTGFVIINDRGEVLDANPEYVCLTGHKTMEEIRGRSVTEWTAAYEKEKNAEAVRKCFRNGSIRNFEVDYVGPRGKVIPVELNATVVKVGGARIVLTLCRDISERRVSETKLRRSEARFRSYFELPGAGIAITSPKKGWMEVNRELCSLLGYSKQELLKRTWSEMTHPDDLAADLALFKRMLAGKIERYSLDKRFIRKDGKVVWTNLAVSCVRKPDGSVDYVVAVIWDITKRKQMGLLLEKSARDWQSTFDSVNDAVWLLDLDHRIVRCNQATRKIFGKNTDKFLGKHCCELVHGTQEPPPECPMRVMRKTLRRASAELSIGDKWILVTVDPILDAAGKLTGAVHTVKDITTFKRNELARTRRVMIDETIAKMSTRLAISTSREINQVIPESLAAIGSVFESQRVFIVLADPVQKKWQCPYEWAAPRITRVRSWIKDGVPFGVMRWSEREILKGKILKFRSIDDYPAPAAREKWFHKRMHIESSLIVPMRGSQGKVLGYIGLHSLIRGKDWSDADMKQMQIIGNTIAGAFERAEAEDALRESRDLSASTLRTIPFPMDVVDEDGNILMVNKPMEELVGSHVVGKKCWNVYKDNKHRCGHCPLKSKVLTGQTRTIEVAGVMKDRIVEIHHTGMIFAGKKAVLEVFIDITERKKSDELLRDSEERFRTIYENAPVMIDAFDLQGRCTLWNKQCEKTFGWTMKEIKACKNPLLLFYPDRAVRKQARETVTSKPEGIFREWHPHTKSGSVLTCLWANFRLPDGTVINLGYDITERKKMEENLRTSEGRLKQQFQRMPVGAILFQPDFRILSWNPMAERIFGYSAKQAVGKHAYELIVPKKIRPLVNPIWSRLLKGDKTAHSVNENVTRSGKTILCKWTNTPLRGPGGQIFGILSMVEDITAKMLAEEELKNNERRLRALSENLGDGMVYQIKSNLGGKNRQFTFLSSAVKRMHGLSVEKVLRDPMALYGQLSREDQRRVAREETKAARQRKTFETEVQVKLPSGDVRWRRFVSSPRLTEDRKELIWDGIEFDITEKKLAEGKAVRAQFQYQTLVQNAKDGIFTLKPSGAFALVNPEFCAMLGYKPNELMRLHILDTYPKGLSKLGSQRMKKLRKGETLRFERSMKRKDGTLIDIEAIAWKDQMGGIQAFIRDITERKRAENSLKEQRRQLLQIIDTVPHMIFAKDRHGRFLLVNRAVAEAYQQTPKTLIGMRRQDVHKDRKEIKAFLKADREVFSTGKPIIVSNEPFTDSVGHKRILQTIKIPFKMTGMEETCILGVSVDVTEQRKVEEFRNDIVRTVSHELRTPLSIEKEGISLLMDGMLGPVNAEQKEVMETIMRSIDRLGRMITSLLDISSIETGKITLNEKMTDLVSIVRGTVSEFSKRAAEKGVALNMNLAEDMAPIYADPDKIIQVISNLLDNAIKFTPAGGEVEISVNSLRDMVECQVRDNGIGIASENVGKLFEKFQQFSRTAGPGEKGFGLGLSIAKGIIELHGGRIWIKSELGKGTRAAFSLPIYKKEE